MKVLEFNSSLMGPEFDHGIESTVFNYNDNEEEALIKIYRESIVSSEESNNIPYRYNKERKIRMLSTVKDSSLVPVKDLVYKKGQLIGYTMNKADGDIITLGDSRKRKIEYLKQIRENMLRLNSHGIYIGDFSEKNFLMRPDGKVTHLDIDNYSIDGTDFDIKTTYMRNFNISSARKELIDRYCFNIFALAILGKYAIGYCNIHTMKLPLSMMNSHNFDVLDEMRYLDEDYTGKVFKFTRKDEEY